MDPATNAKTGYSKGTPLDGEHPGFTHCTSFCRICQAPISTNSGKSR
jgi:hypothetical protein